MFLTLTALMTTEEAGSVGVLLLVRRLPFWVTFRTRAAASRGGPAAWPTPADCGGAADIAAAAAAAGGADEVGVVVEVRSHSVLRPHSRRGHAHQGRSGRTSPRQAVRLRRRRLHHLRCRSPLRLARRLRQLRLTCR